MVSISGWMVISCSREEEGHFKVTAGDGTVYKFVPTPGSIADVWVQKLQMAAEQHNPKVSVYHTFFYSQGFGVRGQRSEVMGLGLEVRA